MNEFVGLPDIGKAVGVSYHDLWLAVRVQSVILRVDCNRSGKPYVATREEIKQIRNQLKPDITPAPSKKEDSQIGVMDGMAKFIESVNRLEEKLDCE